MAKTIMELQGSHTVNESVDSMSSAPLSVKTLDDLGKEIVTCCAGLDITEVHIHILLRLLPFLPSHYLSSDMDIPADRRGTSPHEGHGHSD